MLSRVETETNALNQTTVYTYDDTAGGCSSCSGGSGNLASVTDPAGRTTFYEYDDGDRLTTVTYSNSSDLVVHTYDEYGRRIMTFDNRLPVADFPTQTFTWTYDKFDRMLTETYPDGEQVVWTYDINGRRTSLTDPDGNESSYFYNELSNNKKLLAVVHPFAEDIFSYNSKGLLEYDRVFDPGQYAHKYGSSLMKQGGGYTPFAYDEEERTVIRHTYDTLNRLKTQEYHLNYEPARVHYITATHNYNAASMRTSTVYTSPHPYLYTSFLPHTMSYSYDDTYRLVSEIRLDDTDATEWTNTYTYDPAGNRTYSAHYNGTTTSTLSSQFNAFNQLNYSSVNGSYGFLSDYDQSGNLIAKEPIYGDTEVYYHDRENRLDRHRLEYSPGYGPLQSYYYDFSGRLLMRVNNNGHKEKYYYDGINRLLTREEPDALCSRTKEVFALKPSAIGQVFLRRTYTYTGSGGNCQAGKMSHDMFYNYDPVGNVIAELPRYTASVNPVDMGAFGQVYTGGYDGPRLTTKHYDGASGLYYFGARWYDPVTGRWIEKEPLGLDGPNWYHFNFGNPGNRFDLWGESSVWFSGYEHTSWREKVWFFGAATHPVQIGSRVAAAKCYMAADQAGKAYGHDHPDGNAMRHCVWQCCLTRELGASTATALGNAHEPLLGGGRDTSIDQLNNSKGRGLGSVNCSMDCFDQCKGVLDAGRLHR